MPAEVLSVSILDHIERALFGASAAEAVEMRLKLAERRLEQRLERALDTMLEEDDSTPEDPDQAPGSVTA